MSRLAPFADDRPIELKLDKCLENVSGTENTLKVGDRVNYPPFGNGIVLETEVAQQNTLVGFDAPPRELHSGLNAKGYYGGTKYEQKCWWIADKNLKVIKEEPKTTKSNTNVLSKQIELKLDKCLENVEHPNHYTAGGIGCIDAIHAVTKNLIGMECVCTANVLKYIWRWKLKNGVEDLKKAKWYLEYLIDYVEGDK